MNLEIDSVAKNKMVMTNDIQKIISSLDSFCTLESSENLNHLQELADLYFSCPEAVEYLDVWFRLYERFPEDDNCDIFWSILHGIEAYPDSDKLVVQSVIRQPAKFPLMMVNRILNGGIDRVGDVDLRKLLDAVATNKDYSATIREHARDYLNYQQEKS